jgi:hypothetical protein
MSTFECCNCHRNIAHQSRKRGVFERTFLPLFLLPPVRCEHCFRRQYVTVVCQVSEPGLPEENSPGALSVAV